MGLVGLFLVVSIVIFFIVFSNPQARQGEAFQIISGFIEVLIINFLLIILPLLLVFFFSSLSISAYILMRGFGGLGLLQLFYVVPRSLYLRRRRRWAKLKGVIAAAVIVALLNGGCWIFVMGLGGI